MAKMNIGFDTKSIQKAISKIEKLQKDIPTIVVPRFIELCLLYIRKRADTNLDNSGIGSNVIEKIKSQWKVPTTKEITNKGTLINEDVDGQGKNKAVFVEFGVGIAGKGTYDNMFGASKYEYDVPSSKKDATSGWRFGKDKSDSEIDINPQYFVKTYSNNIYTHGQPAVMFLHNAIFDFINQRAFQVHWQTALESYYKANGFKKV